MNGVRGAGFFTASVSSSIAAVILSLDDVFSIVTFVGENSIVSETLLPPVVVSNVNLIVVVVLIC